MFMDPETGLGHDPASQSNPEEIPIPGTPMGSCGNPSNFLYSQNKFNG